MASTKLTRTFSADSNRKKFTVSVWVKKAQNASSKAIWGGEISTGYVWLLLGPTLYFQQNPSSSIEFQSSAKFRDVNGWYHIVQQVDTAQATASNRMKFWVNGEQITNWPTSTYPSQNEDIKFQSAAYPLRIGEFGNSYWDGSMSHFHWCDGYAYQASDFGETDPTTGQWSIKTAPSVSYGTNGFWILKDGNSVTDSSPNSNNFTVAAGNLTKTEDNPSNVFCTGNPLAKFSGNVSYSNGNNTFSSGNGWFMGAGTMGASTGKYYYEYKITTLGTGNGYHKIGFMSDIGIANSKAAGHIAEAIVDGSYAFYCQNGNLEVRTDDAVISGYDISTLGVSFSNGDIMCLAIDMDNKRAYFRKNGDAWIKSANPVTGTNGLDISSDYPTGKFMIPAFASYYNGVGSLNFGNGYFGTTAVSSAGTNASGNGIFEYDVPTGYTALSTKGLNL